MTTLQDFAPLQDDIVQYYDHIGRELKASQGDKAERLVSHDCIQYIKDVPDVIKGLFPQARNVFICLPLNTSPTCSFYGLEFDKRPHHVDYNGRAYLIYKSGDTFVCNCQGFQTRLKKGGLVAGAANCSHVLALYKAFKLRKFGNSGIPGDKGG